MDAWDSVIVIFTLGVAAWLLWEVTHRE